MYTTKVGKYIFKVRDRLQISLLILREFKRTD